MDNFRQLEKHFEKYLKSEVVDAPSSGSWEAGVEALWENLIAPAGFELVRLSRVPYISEGDHKFGAYVLDDAVFVLRAPPS